MKRIALTVASKGMSITPQELIDAQEAEGNMALQDKLLAQTAEAVPPSADPNPAPSSCHQTAGNRTGRIASCC